MAKDIKEIDKKQLEREIEKETTKEEPKVEKPKQEAKPEEIKPVVEKKPEKKVEKKQKKVEEKAEEKLYTFSLRDAWRSPRNKRSKAAINILKKQIKRHTKKEPKIDISLNREIWQRGIQKPPRKIKVLLRITATEAKAYPAQIKEKKQRVKKEKKPKKTEKVKKEAKKPEPKVEDRKE